MIWTGGGNGCFKQKWILFRTLSTLIGQSMGLRKLYPIKGIKQRTELRTRHNHICGWLRPFLATPRKLKTLGNIKHRPSLHSKNKMQK